MEIKIIIEDGLWKGARAARYHSTPEEIEERERRKRIQRERDELARKLAFDTSPEKEQESSPQNEP